MIHLDPEIHVTRWRIPGSPRDIPTGAAVPVIETVTIGVSRYRDRFGAMVKHPPKTRHRVRYAGHDYWIDDEALEAA